MRQDLQSALAAARALSPDELPELLGELEQVRCTAMARLSVPAPRQTSPDELLDVQEASRRLGVSAGYLYRHHRKLPFTRRVGRKLLFSSLGVGEYLRRRQ
jgi:excisionase family DNA binding protein